MSSADLSATTQNLSPTKFLNQMLTGYWLSQALYVAAKLGLPDLLESGVKRPEDLARATGTHPEALYRLLRALASVGVFSERPDGSFVQTPLSSGLRSPPAGGQRAMAIMMGEEHYRAWGELLYSVRTGKPAFDHLFGKPIFEYLAEHPEQARTFDDAMTGVHGAETRAMLNAYDFSRIGTLVDVGGGNGSLLSVVLQQHTAMKGILFDRPDVVENARGNLRRAGVDARCTLIGGNFFESAPPGGDAYLLRHIIHDWDDAQSLTILRNARKAMKPKSRLLVVESVIPPGNNPFFGKLLDLAMLVLPGGQERTEAKYGQLFTAAGFRLSRIVPADQEVSVIEGEPV
ncbi:MAG TPA: methyltransferase [Gemmataceae bacterium]|nr:methyltransferase [Gemmataceae bacterium]